MYFPYANGEYASRLGPRRSTYVGVARVVVDDLALVGLDVAVVAQSLAFLARIACGPWPFSWGHMP
jgi:hypothetical protein